VQIKERNNGAGHFLEVEYTTESGLPHSKQHDFDLDVINPQFGHILCDPYPATCGLGLRIQWTSRTMNNTISRLKEILAAFMKATLLGDRCTKNEWAGDHSLKSLRCGSTSDGLA